MSYQLKCNECGEQISDDDDPHSCDFCDKTLCDDCVLFWRDDEIGDEGKSCSGCAGDEPATEKMGGAK